MDDEILKEIENEIKNLSGLPEEEPLPEVEEIKPKKERRGKTKEQMHELTQIKKTKAEERRILREKKEEVERIKQEKIEMEYEEALKLKAIEEKKNKAIQVKPDVRDIKKENKDLIKVASRDIIKEKYFEEAKRRVMADLFS
jgi:hypothetical protein